MTSVNSHFAIFTFFLLIFENVLNSKEGVGLGEVRWVGEGGPTDTILILRNLAIYSNPFFPVLKCDSM